MENNPHEKTWEELQEHGLLPNIAAWMDYVIEYNSGLARCHGFLAEVENLWSQETLVTTHRLLFESIAPWAGEFSSRQEVIASIPGSPPELRSREFDLLEKQMEVLEETAAGESARIRMVAFFHSRLLCMHPFRDGNGRVSRLLLAHQMNRITGKYQPLNKEKPAYIETLQAAHPSGNLAPLSNLLHQSYLGKPDPAKFLPVPFRMHSIQLEQHSSKIEDSLREGPDIINVEKTPEKVRWLVRIPWSEVEQLCAAKARKTLPDVEKKWRENQGTPFSPDELATFLRKLEELHPWTQPVGILRRPQGTSWKPVLNKLLEPWPSTPRKGGPEIQ